LAAINAALSNTQLPTMTADLDENDGEMDDDATCKRLMRRRNKFRANTEKMLQLQVADQPHYSGFLVYNAETDKLSCFGLNFLDNNSFVKLVTIFTDFSLSSCATHPINLTNSFAVESTSSLAVTTKSTSGNVQLFTTH
jgi:hypothetical protein